MFRAILQKNPKALKGLICSLLHLTPDQIISVEIKNPIVLGEKIDDKYFVLDIHVLMNDNTFINLEMQVANQSDWSDRSLSYLCRAFDQLSHGQEYEEIKPAIHIGFLDFTPFPEVPEFYATYKMLNIKNHHLYSSKFVLNVVDLSHIELATDEDKAYQIDYWARLFKATTWEDIKMLAKNNEFLQEASETLYEMNAEDAIREQCRARADFMRSQNIARKKLAEQERTIAEQNITIATLNAQSLKDQALLADKDTQLADKDTQLADKDALIADKDAEIAELKRQLVEKQS